MSAGRFEIGNWSVAILAGGLGRRLNPITQEIPKVLIKVAGQPFLAHQLRLLQAAGFRKVVLCVGHRGEMIQKEFADGRGLGMALTYSFDGPQLLGTGGALRKALPFLGEKFFVLYGDSYLPIDYAEPMRAFIASGQLGLMTVFRNEDRWVPSNVSFDGGIIKSYNKNEPGSAMKHIDYGLGLLCSEAFRPWPEGKPFDLANLYCDLIARGELAGYEVGQRFYEIGSPAGLAELDAVLRDRPVSATT